MRVRVSLGWVASRTGQEGGGRGRTRGDLVRAEDPTLEPLEVRIDVVAAHLAHVAAAVARAILHQLTGTVWPGAERRKGRGAARTSTGRQSRLACGAPRALRLRRATSRGEGGRRPAEGAASCRASNRPRAGDQRAIRKPRDIASAVARTHPLPSASPSPSPSSSKRHSSLTTMTTTLATLTSGSAARQSIAPWSRPCGRGHSRGLWRVVFLWGAAPGKKAGLRVWKLVGRVREMGPGR